jgi:hypothetical protein
MKNFKQFLINLALGFIGLNIFGALLCTGDSPPPMPMSTKEVYFPRVPTSSAISP